MEEDSTRQSSYRFPGMPVLVGRVSNPSAHPVQNGGFPDGFLTKRCVEASDSEEPGKTTDPLNPMKSRDYTPSDGYPADPPVSSKRPAAICGPLCFGGPHCLRREWDENPAAGLGFERTAHRSSRASLTCGKCSKWASRVASSPCSSWAMALIQMSLVGIGVPWL